MAAELGVMIATMAFSEILSGTQKRTGGALEKELPRPRSGDELRATGDDRYLSLMSLRIFRAGLKHSMVDAKWPAFEEVFAGFDPLRVRAMSDEDLEKLMADRRLIRHWGKIKAVRANAATLIAVSEEHGGFGTFLADWPGHNIMAL